MHTGAPSQRTPHPLSRLRCHAHALSLTLVARAPPPAHAPAAAAPCFPPRARGASMTCAPPVGATVTTQPHRDGSGVGVSSDAHTCITNPEYGFSIKHGEKTSRWPPMTRGRASPAADVAAGAEARAATAGPAAPPVTPPPPPAPGTGAANFTSASPDNASTAAQAPARTPAAKNVANRKHHAHQKSSP